MRERLRIRRARLAEAPALTALTLRSKALWGYDDAFMALCRAELTVKPEAIAKGEVWVAETGGGLAGVLELVPEDRQEGRAVEVRLIFVDPTAVRAGVGTALWRHAEARAAALGAGRLTLDADPNAVPFYEHMGLQVIGQSPSGSIPGRMLPRMGKALA